MPAPRTSPALARCTEVDAADFAATHWSRTPLLTRAKELPRGFDDLLSVTDVDELVSGRALRTPFFRTVKQGGSLPVPLRTISAGNRRIGDVVDPEALQAQFADGATLVLQALHRLHPPVVDFCRALAEDLGHATQCNAYVTPAGDAQGFDFHHDTHDVFVLQVSGRKRWVVHEPVVRLPLSSQPQAGAHLVRDGAEPLLDIELEAGDCLYLPRGYVHAALTTDTHSVHLTVGVLSTTWYDVLNDAVSLAGDDEAFRDALPVQPLEALDDLPAFLRRAADWLAAAPPDRLREVVVGRLQRAVPPEPVRLLAAALTRDALSPTTALRPRRGLHLRLAPAADGRVALQAPGKALELPASTRAALERMLDGPLQVRDLAVGGLDEADALVLARRAMREGLLVPDTAAAPSTTAVPHTTETHATETHGARSTSETHGTETHGTRSTSVEPTTSGGRS